MILYKSWVWPPLPLSPSVECETGSAWECLPRLEGPITRPEECYPAKAHFSRRYLTFVCHHNWQPRIPEDLPNHHFGWLRVCRICNANFWKKINRLNSNISQTYTKIMIKILKKSSLNHPPRRCCEHGSRAPASWRSSSRTSLKSRDSSDQHG